MTANERLDELEEHLSEYHELLAESIAERDRLALDAAWGVHGQLYTLIAVFAIIYGFERFIGTRGWMELTGVVIAIVGAQLLVPMWSNSERMKEVDRFARLPEWKPNKN